MPKIHEATFSTCPSTGSTWCFHDVIKTCRSENSPEPFFYHPCSSGRLTLLMPQRTPGETLLLFSGNIKEPCCSCELKPRKRVFLVACLLYERRQLSSLSSTTTLSSLLYIIISVERAKYLTNHLQISS